MSHLLLSRCSRPSAARFIAGHSPRVHAIVRGSRGARCICDRDGTSLRDTIVIDRPQRRTALSNRPILSRVILNPPFHARACADHLYGADRNLSISPLPAKALLANDRISRGAVSRGEYEIDTFYDISDESSERASFFLQYISHKERYIHLLSLLCERLLFLGFFIQKGESL